MLNFVGLIGTNSKESNNRRLLQFMQKHFADKATIELVEIDNIPLFNKPAKMKVPEVVSELAKKILKDFDNYIRHFKKIVPNDLIRFILLAILSITVICLGLLSYPIKFFYYLIFFELGVQFSKYQFHHRISLLLNLCIVIAVVFTCTINKIPSIDTFLKHLILNPVMVIFYWKLSFLVSNNSILLKLGKYSFYIFLFHEPIIVRGISELINSTVVYSSFAYVCMVTGLSIIVTLLFVKIYLYGKSKRVIIWIKKATNSVN